MKPKYKFMLVGALALVLLIGITVVVSAVSGAAFTTFNAHVDGSSKNVCKQTAINCNHYGAKEYVWLNGGPAANGLGPDGQYFFAVLEPGGQPNPNDGAVVPGVANGDKNLSDDYDAYTNRIFTVTDGEVSAYSGDHWLDSGKNEPGPGDPKPNGLPPFIRLYPYSDTTNPGGVYIMAICSLEDGYPVDPRDCKYDAFKVKKVTKLEVSFMLSGIKFLDVNGDSGKVGDPGLAGWTITIKGTAPDGSAINTSVVTGANGYWEWFSPVYVFTGNAKPQNVTLEVCEVLQGGWTQTYPGGDGCHDIAFTPTGFESFFDIDFGNGKPAIDVEKSCPAVVRVGLPIDYDFDVTNTGNVNLVNVNVSDPTIGFDNNPNIALAPGASQHYDAQITPSSPQVINNTVNASGDYGLTTVFATATDSDNCSTSVVDARISIVQSDKNGITEPHTFTVTVEKNDGTGWTPAANVVVTPSESGVGDITGETCSAGTDVNGQCTVTVNSNTAGQSTVNASATVSVGGLDVNVATNGYGAYVVSNVKTWVAGSLVWFKYDDANHLLGGATFEVCRTHDRFGNDIADVCVTVKDNNSPDEDADNGEFLLTGLVLGRYTIEETVPPVGFKGDTFVDTIELSLDYPNGTASHIWVNVPFEGCTPGFWQGGNDFGTAGGKWLWNEILDPQWVASGGAGFNPYIWTTLFNDFFAPYGGLAGFDMMDLVGTGGGPDDFQKAARMLVAAYLNSSWGMNYPYTTAELKDMWADAVTSGDFASLHNTLGTANESKADTDGDGVGDTHMCPISASGY